MLSHDEFLPAVRELREAEARFLSLSAMSLDSGEVELSYFFEKGEEVRTLQTCTHGRSAPSLFSFYGAADFPEREASRTYGIKFVGHPNLQRAAE